MNIKDSITAFDDYARVSRAGSTVRTYANALQVFIDHIQDNGLNLDSPTNEINTTHFVSFSAALLKRGYSKTTINTYLSGVRFYYEWMVMNGLIPLPNYKDTLLIQRSTQDARRRREKKIARYPTAGHAETMVEAVADLHYKTPVIERDIALVHLLFSSGCRNAEATGLCVKDIDMDQRAAVVTGKGSKQRWVYFDQSTADALSAYWTARGWAGPNDPAFARHDRGAGKKHQHLTTTTVRNIVDDARKLAGIPKGKFTPHYFRHAFAIKVLRETGNLALVQDYLGHADANSTRVYAKISPEELRNTHRKLYE